MVKPSETIDFVNVQEHVDGSRKAEIEAGRNPPWEGSFEDFKYAKFKAKQSPTYSGYYDWTLNRKKGSDPFLKNLTMEEKAAYKKRLGEHYAANAAEYHVEGKMWYFIVHGGKCGLYQEWQRYKNVRDEHFEKNSRDGKKCSWKGAEFHSLEDAKNFLQYCREEDGAHWKWPYLMPIYWRSFPEAKSEADDEAKSEADH